MAKGILVGKPTLSQGDPGIRAGDPLMMDWNRTKMETEGKNWGLADRELMGLVYTWGIKESPVSRRVWCF